MTCFLASIISPSAFFISMPSGAGTIGPSVESEPAESPVCGTTIFTSGSMAGAKMDAVRAALPDAEVVVFRVPPSGTGRGPVVARTFVGEGGEFRVPLRAGRFRVEVRAPG